MREDFFIADPDEIYFDGNSLGRLPIATTARLQELIHQEWGSNLIQSWNEHWLPMQQRCGEKLARLIGAKSTEVLIADSTTVNF